MRREMEDFNSQVQKKLEALAKLEKTSKASILKRILSGYGGCCTIEHNDRFLEITDAEARVLKKIKWL